MLRKDALDWRVGDIVLRVSQLVMSAQGHPPGCPRLPSLSTDLRRHSYVSELG